MQDFLQGILKRTSLFVIITGAILVLIGAATEIAFGTFSIRIPDIGGRAVAVVVGAVLIAFGLFVEWQEYSQAKQKESGLAYASIRTSSRSITTKSESIPLQMIDFNYQDAPLNHGWKISETPDSTQPVFKHVSDGFFGSALKIRSTARYAMDISVNATAQVGQVIEFAAKLEANYAVYAKVNVQSQNGTNTNDIWLNFQVGIDGETRELNEQEWIVYATPNPIGENWSLFRIDLKEALALSFGKKGWRFRKLRGFRLRGNLHMAYIKVL